MIEDTSQMQRVALSQNGREGDSVLIVNDVPEQLTLMDSLLRKAGYSVFTAEDGREAFEVAKVKHPAVVISDVSMPKVNGIEFCRLIRQDDELRSVPILLVTAHRKDTASVVEGLRSGADDYLELPFDSTRLVAKVSRLLERARVEAQLRESEERYRLLFEATPQPIWVYDENTLAFLAVNEAAVSTYGYSREEFFSMTINDLMSPDGGPALLIKTATGADEPVLSSPWRHRRKDRSSIYVELTSHSLVFNGRQARLVIASDVTERKLLDEKQQKMHESLQHSAMEWRQTYNAIDFPVLIVELDGTIRRLNQAAEEIAGIESEKILGRDISKLGPNEPWCKAAELIKTIRGNGTSSSAVVKDSKDGKTWAITLYLINEFGSAGERAILIAQDITKRAELEASLHQSEMMSLLGSLVAGVAHEVRNPLFGISSILDAFETRFGESTDYLRYTNVLRDEVSRLTILMEELLEYGRPFRGDFYPASLTEVITKSLRSCVPAAKVAQVKLVNGIDGELPPIMVDRRRLSKVFVNLIENAIQHSTSGREVTVVARQVEEGNQRWLDCSVKDSGPGISDDDLPMIFEPFFSKRRGGTGLGLAIAHRIMSEHGGRLIAGNNREGGACMTARFPLSKQEDNNG
jgi:PAS domain S-box-containing protein